MTEVGGCVAIASWLNATVSAELAARRTVATAESDQRPLHRGPGEVNYPVSVGGIVVNPGDVIVGDADGVVVVPQESAESMLRRLDTRAAAAAEYQSAVARGEFSNAWVDTMLDGNGLESEPDLD